MIPRTFNSFQDHRLLRVPTRIVYQLMRVTLFLVTILFYNFFHKHRILTLHTSENRCDILNLLSILYLFFSCSSSLYLMSSSLWSTSSMLSSFMMAAAAASLSLVGDLCVLDAASSGLAGFFGVA